MLTVSTVSNLKPAQICLHKQPNTPQSEVGMQSVCSSFLLKKKKVGNSSSRIGSGHICYCTFLVWFTPLQWWKTGFWKKLLIEAQIFLCCCSIKSSSCSSRVKVTPKPQTDWFRFRHLNSFVVVVVLPNFYCNNWNEIFSISSTAEHLPVKPWRLQHCSKQWWELSVPHAQWGLSEPFWFADTMCLVTWYYKRLVFG